MYSLVNALQWVKQKGEMRSLSRRSSNHEKRFIPMAVIGYCVKCKGKKEMVNPQEGVTKNNRIITKGTCPDCGTKMSLIGGLKK